ncbi:MAG: glycosyltransferase family 39 protein [Bryobacteraceae bacterium]|nr:glycosyltransferase family 39 protein [Bryobacteraceae bacterium]
MFTRLRSVLIALLALPVIYALYFHELAGVGMIDPDEPRYASIGREMAKSGDWITPRLWGNEWFEKPALLYWMIGLGHKLGLPGELAARLPIALLSLAFAVFFYWRVRGIFGELPARFATLALATSAGWVAYSHFAVTDLPLAVCFGAAMLLYLEWANGGDQWLVWTAGACLGLAVLAKGLVPLVLALPALWFSRDQRKEWWKPVVALLVVALPWYAACYAANGWLFIDVFIVRHHFSRFADDTLKHAQPFWFYVPVLIGAVFPWSPALLLTARADSLRDPRRQYVVAWLLWTLLFFSLATNKLPGYLLPLLPAAAILIGLALAEVEKAYIALIAGALLLGLVPLVAEVLPIALADGLSHAKPGDLPWRYLAIGAIGAGLVFRHEYATSRAAAVSLLAIGSVAGIAYLKREAFPKLEAQVSARPLWRGIAPRRAEICMGNMERRWRYGLNYYAVKPLPDCLVAPRPVILEQRGGDRPLPWIQQP